MEIYGTPLSTPIYMKWDGQEHRRDTKQQNIQGNDGWKLSNFNENINLHIQIEKWAPCGISANDPQTNILILKLLKDKEKKTSKQPLYICSKT